MATRIHNPFLFSVNASAATAIMAGIPLAIILLAKPGEFDYRWLWAFFVAWALFVGWFWFLFMHKRKHHG